jgi:hypothetical protein
MYKILRPILASRNSTRIQESLFATMTTSALPKGFLTGPAPCLTKSKIDFTKEGIPGYEGKWAVVLDGVLTREECRQLVAAAEATTGGTWTRAQVNIGGGQQAMLEDTRKCGRIIWDSRELMDKLLGRISSAVPEIHSLENWPSVTGNGPAKRNEVWKMTRLNDRARFLKYVGGEYFKGVFDRILFEGTRHADQSDLAHTDGTYETPDQLERSYFTLHLYLNDPDEGEERLLGGATTFHAPYAYNRMEAHIDVAPKVGRVLLFQHRGLLHSGEDVLSGTKLTMRTDVMYADRDDLAEREFLE